LASPAAISVGLRLTDRSMDMPIPGAVCYEHAARGRSVDHVLTVADRYTRSRLGGVKGLRLCLGNCSGSRYRTSCTVTILMKMFRQVQIRNYSIVPTSNVRRYASPDAKPGPNL
jgi:hypothetical protein